MATDSENRHVVNTTFRAMADCVWISILAIAFFAPGVAAQVIAPLFPEARLIGSDQLDGLDD